MKPILEIRVPTAISCAQLDQLHNAVSEMFPDLSVIVLDEGMTAHIHDDSILKEIAAIRKLLEASQVINPKTITAEEAYNL